MLKMLVIFFNYLGVHQNYYIASGLAASQLEYLSYCIGYLWLCNKLPPNQAA